MSQIELLILRAGSPERRMVLPAGVAHVGRAEDNQVVLADVGVSRRHARLEVVGTSLVIEDLGSGNGTWFRGRPIQRQVLGPGEEAVIDPFTLRVAVSATRDMPEITVGRDATIPLKSAPPAATLTVVSAHRMARREFPLPTTGSITIGRSEKNAVVLPEPASSRVHAEIQADGGGWLVRDFGSSNGTFVNARRIKERHLDDGDRIRIGTVELRFGLIHEAEGTEGFADAIVSAPGGVRTLPPPPPPPATRSFPLPPPANAFRPAVSIPDPEPSDASAFPPPFRPIPPEDASAAVELELDPRRSRGRKLAAPRRNIGFLSRPINQISIGILAITFLLVTGKIASDVLSSLIRPAPTVAAAPTGPPAPVTPGTAPATPGVTPPEVTPPAASATANPAATDPLMAEGMQAFAEARYFDAAGSFYRVLQIDPNHRDARRMGYVACEFISLAEMRAALVQRTTTDSARAEAKRLALDAAAKVAGGTLNVTEARPPIDAALALTPDDAELVAARAALDGKQASQARAASAGRAAAQTKDIKAKLATAQADLDGGRLAKAVRGFEAVMAADPTHSAPEYYQAEEGARDAKDRMRTESKSAWAAANTAIKADDWLTARKRLDEVVGIDPYNESAAAKLTEAKRHLKESASEVYKEARVLEEMGQTEKALALYHKVQLYVNDESDPLAQKAQARTDALLR